MSDAGRSPSSDGPIPAATVIPIRDGESGLEVLLLRRSSRGQFGDMWVFPGGHIDAADRAAPAVVEGEDPEIAAGRIAAVREAEEEAGLILDPTQLVVLSFWLAPPSAPKRFATWFFVCIPDVGTQIVVDQLEIHEHMWVGPGEAITMRQEGRIELAPPTFTTLWWLEQRADATTVLAEAASRPPERFATHIAFTAGREKMATLWDGDAGYEDGDMDRPGPRRRLIMDPAGWRVEMSL